MKVIIYADGGSRGNPGIAGSGSVVYAAEGQRILRRVAYVVGQQATNNVAEYHALINGLAAARDLGAREALVKMDSKLVVEQMSGRWKIKHADMKRLALQAQSIMGEIGPVTFQWIPRAENTVADELANIAMDAAQDGHAPGFLALEKEDDTVTTDVTPEDVTGAAEPVTRLILIRHGETALSTQGRFAGHLNVELTERGHEQAQAVAEFLERQGGIDAILTSPLLRTQQTAAHLADLLSRPVIPSEALIELDFGEWDGRQFEEVRAEDPQTYQQWLADTDQSCPQGESLAGLHRRVTQLRQQIVARYPGQTVALVTHVHPIKSFIGQALGLGPEICQHVFVSLASISVVEFRGEQGMLRAFNVTP